MAYECRICGHFEKAKPEDEADNCVYKSEHLKMSDKLIIDKECIKDPTLQRRKNVQCSQCPCTEVVTFTQHTKDRMNMIFVCVQCCHNWRKDKLEPEEIVDVSDSESDTPEGEVQA